MPKSDIKKKRGPLRGRSVILSKKKPIARGRNAAAEPQQKPWLYPALMLIVFLLGNLTGYTIGDRKSQNFTEESQSVTNAPEANEGNQKGLDFDAMLQQVNPPEGFDLSVRYADLGPRLIDAGVIDYGKFAAVLENAGEPLTSSQIEILQGSDAKMVITPENAHFLLNFFWAVGLANKNKILTEGPMVQRSEGKIENFASTGGWTLGAKPVTELYASLDLISLDPEQQARVEEVASAVYRPCCNNPTLFPDCNHGMAMLGLLELMASQGASVDKMFETAKSMNAYWFPQQAMETAIFLKSTQNIDFGDADGRLLVGKEFFSSSGFSKIHQILQTNGLLQTLPGGNNGCST